MEISGILWSRQSIGVAWNKLKDQDIIEITVKDKNGNLLHPGKYKVDKQDLLERYGPLEIINKGGLWGVFIPRRDLLDYKIEETENN